MPNSDREDQAEMMATALQLPVLQPFSAASDQTTLRQRWSKWVKGLEYFLTVSNFTDKKQKRAVLLHLAGAEVQTIFETLNDTGEDYDAALAKLNEYFVPKKNIPFERHTFRQAVQEPTEGIDAYVTRLRGLAKTCKFDKVDEMIRDQVIDKCASNNLCRRLLGETNLKLDGPLQIARSLEASNIHATTIEAGSEQPPQHVNQIASESENQETRRRNKRYKKPKNSGGKDKGTKQGVCFCCGRAGHRAKDPSCPAVGKQCGNCGKQGHFAKVRQKGLTKEQVRVMSRNTGMDFGM